MCSVSVSVATVARLGVPAACKYPTWPPLVTCNCSILCAYLQLYPTSVQAHWYLADLQVATSPVSLMRLVRCSGRSCKSNPVTQLLPRCRVSRPAWLPGPARPGAQTRGKKQSVWPQSGAAVPRRPPGPPLQHSPCTTTHAVMPG